MRQLLIPIVAALGIATASIGSTTEAKITVTNKIVKGKKTWLPKTIKVKSGQSVMLNLVNTLDAPHGFEAPGLTEAIVVEANKTKVVTIKPKKKGEFKYRCHLHPAHVGGEFLVQ